MAPSVVAVAEVFAKPRLAKAGVRIGLRAPVFVFTRPLVAFPSCIAGLERL